MMDSGTQGLLRISENQGGMLKKIMRRGAILVTGMYLTVEDVFVGPRDRAQSELGGLVSFGWSACRAHLSSPSCKNKTLHL